MEHSIESSDLRVRPWRRATLIVTAIAGLELVLLVAAAFVLAGKSLAPGVKSAARKEALVTPKVPATSVPRTAPPATAKPRAFKPPKKAAPLLPRSKTTVTVLNGNGFQGAAADAAAVARTRGYPIGDVSNAPGAGYARWLVMYRPGFRAEAARFAKDMNVKVVTPLDGIKPAQLHGAKLLLILGARR